MRVKESTHIVLTESTERGTGSHKREGKLRKAVHESETDAKSQVLEDIVLRR